MRQFITNTEEVALYDALLLWPPERLMEINTQKERHRNKYRDGQHARKDRHRNRQKSEKEKRKRRIN